jgi:hypothetical protein
MLAPLSTPPLSLPHGSHTPPPPVTPPRCRLSRFSAFSQVATAFAAVHRCLLRHCQLSMRLAVYASFRHFAGPLIILITDFSFAASAVFFRFRQARLPQALIDAFAIITLAGAIAAIDYFRAASQLPIFAGIFSATCLRRAIYELRLLRWLAAASFGSFFACASMPPAFTLPRHLAYHHILLAADCRLF